MHPRWAALPHLGVGISAEPGSARRGIDACRLVDAHPHLVQLVEYGSDVARGLDEHIASWHARGGATTYHFLDLNLEDAADLDDHWIARTAAHAEAIGAAWLCGDAGLWHFGRRDRAHSLLLPPVLTRDSAYAIADNVRRLSDATGFAVLPENPPAAFYLGDLHLLDYFAILAERADCGIVLDCAHLAIYQRLHGLAPTTGLDGFPLERVLEAHVAGGALVDVDGLILVDDAHGPQPLPETWQIWDRLRRGARDLRAVIYECEKNDPSAVVDGFARLNRDWAELHPIPASRRLAPPRMITPVGPATVPRPELELAAQRISVRLLHDAKLHAAAQRSPDEVLAALPPLLRRQIAELDPRALQLDRLRALKLVGLLCEEWKASTTLLLAATRSGAFLSDFVCSAAFHQAVDEEDLVWAAFGRYLAEQRLPPGAAPLLPDLLVLESALGRARRARQSAPEFRGPLDDQVRLAWADGVTPIVVDEAALGQLSEIERWLFERALIPQAALATDGPAPRILPRSGRARSLAVVPMNPSPALVEIDDPLRQLLVAVGREARPLPKVVDEAQARGWQPDAARTLLAELVDQEILRAELQHVGRSGQEIVRAEVHT